MHRPEFKAQVMAALGAGDSAHQVAERFSMPRTTVRRWRKELWAHVTGNGPQKKETPLDGQLLGYLAESIESQRAQTMVMQDADWLQQQGARGLAMLFGVVFDKTERLLVALEQGGARERA